jgi:hypothetical protein
MLIELCANNHATFDGLINGPNDIFKASTTYDEKTIIWVMFQNYTIGILISEKYNLYYNDNIQSKWTPIEPITKTQSFVITRIQFSIHLAIRTIHCSQGLLLNELIFYPTNDKKHMLTYIIWFHI